MFYIILLPGELDLQLIVCQLHGSPVLFVPGNAGSSRQARSIASSAIRQTYEAPHLPTKELQQGTSIRPIDVFTGEPAVSRWKLSLTFKYSGVQRGPLCVSWTYFALPEGIR